MSDPVGSVAVMLTDRRCISCGHRDGPLCRTCVDRLRPAPTVGATTGLASCRGLLRYDDDGRAVVLALKHRRTSSLVELVGNAMATLAPGSVASVTWAPTTGVRRRARGFDQAELLAVRIGRTLGLPCQRRLDRAPGTAQVGRDRAGRLIGPSFRALGAAHGPVLLVDDVPTTGATLTEAAIALRQGGAAEVHGLVAAVTSPPDASDSHASRETGSSSGR